MSATTDNRIAAKLDAARAKPGVNHYVVHNDMWTLAKTRIFVSAKSEESALAKAVKYIRARYRSVAASTRSYEIGAHQLSVKPHRAVVLVAKTIHDEGHDCILIRNGHYYHTI